MRAQSSSLDFATGFFLFVIILVISGSYLTTRTDQEPPPDGLRISNELLTEGIPADWDAMTVEAAGILTNTSVDDTKWSMLTAMSSAQLRSTLTMRGDAIIRLMRYADGNYSDVLTPISTSGISPADLPDENVKTISVTSRITNHNGSLAILEVITWR